MKITIDTKEDSHEDIQKVLEILKHYAGKNTSPTAEPVDSTDMMSMFDNLSQKEVPDTAPNFSNFMTLLNNKEKKEKLPKVELF